jgi:glycosyltransferase involved in cell wall biosynthesis
LGSSTQFVSSAQFASLARSVPARRRRLLLLSTDMGFGGGAEEQVIRLAYAFQTRNWETMIVSMVPPSPMPADFPEHGIPLVDLGMKRGFPDAQSLFKLSRLIRDFQPDVVHSHMFHANLLARAVRLIQPFPVLVCTLHALTMAGVKRDWTGIFEFAHQITDGLAERTTTVCHAAAKYYVRRRAVPAGKMMMVPNGIDTLNFRPTADSRERVRRELGVEGRFVWLAAARLEMTKAYPTMLRAVARLGEGNHLLLICGQGSMLDDLKKLVSELELGYHVRFLGLRSDVAELMGAADAFALSSDTEGLPLVLLQASAAGLPIVATNVAGNAEVVVDGVSGYLVPPQDPQAFAQAMMRLSGLSEKDRISMGRAGQAWVQGHYEAERVAECWEQLFTELLQNADRPRRSAASAPRQNGLWQYVS